MPAGNQDQVQIAKEFAVYFICVLMVSAGLFKFLEITGITFIYNWGGKVWHDVIISLLPSILAISFIGVGGSYYVTRAVRMGTGSDARIDMITVGDSCYYMGFLLTLWGLFLELLALGSSLQNSSSEGLEGGLVGQLIAGNGLALLSTIMGLVARFGIHRYYALAGTSPNTMQSLLEVMRDHALSFGTFGSDLLSKLQAFGEKLSNAESSKEADDSGGSDEDEGRTTQPGPASELPPARSLVINTHYLSADIDYSGGDFRVSQDSGTVALLARVAELEAKIKKLEPSGTT